MWRPVAFPIVSAAALVSVAASLGSMAATSREGAYGWPVKPFHRPHPIRGNFDDPRGGSTHKDSDFHFGIDISAPDGTMVYATLSGRAYLHPTHPDEVVRVESSRGDGRRFEYWHIVPLIRQGQPVVAYETPLGVIKKGAGHVHFAEFSGAQSLNPLRPGALKPYRDTTAPVVSRIAFQSGRRIVYGSLRGPVDIVAEAYDQPQLPVPPPFAHMPVTPALMRWRILRGGRQVAAWRTAVDFRLYQPLRASFGRVYAPGTRQNRPNRPGRYRFYLAHGWNPSRLRAGRYRLQVAAFDTRENQGAAALDFTIPRR